MTIDVGIAFATILTCTQGSHLKITMGNTPLLLYFHFDSKMFKESTHIFVLIATFLALMNLIISCCAELTLRFYGSYALCPWFLKYLSIYDAFPLWVWIYNNVSGDTFSVYVVGMKS